MEIGEEDLSGPELRPFLRLRLLDLHDHVGLGEDFRRILGDGRAGRDIGSVIGVDAGARLGLDQYLVAVGDILADRTGRQADTGLAALDLFRNTNQHVILPRKTVGG